MEPHAGSPGRSYRYYTGTPTFPAFSGVSLTAFNTTTVTGFSDAPHSFATTSSPPARRSYTVEVRNVGDRPGDEVVMAFIRPNSLDKQPPSLLIRRLVGFERVHLEAGESKQVTFDVSAETFAMVTARGDRVSTPGTFGLEFSTGIGSFASQRVVVDGVEAVLDAFPTAL